MIPASYELKDLELIPKRKAMSNKGDFGHVLVVAGSVNMSGAAFLSASAAYRSGAGLVKVFTVSENRNIILSTLPEAILETYEPQEVLEHSQGWLEKIQKSVGWADVIIVGPGLGIKKYAYTLLKDIMELSFVSTIIDADALNIISKYPDLTHYYTENIIITPHLGEMERLTGEPKTYVNEELINMAKNYSEKYNVNCVLKSHKTVIATTDGRTYINNSGTAALAKAGTGDVLTGIIAGLLCLGLDEGTAASLGSYIHGLAGCEAEQIYGEHGVIASDLLGLIPKVMKKNKKTYIE